MRENADQNDSEYGYFLHSGGNIFWTCPLIAMYSTRQILLILSCPKLYLSGWGGKDIDDSHIQKYMIVGQKTCTIWPVSRELRAHIVYLGILLKCEGFTAEFSKNDQYFCEEFAVPRINLMTFWKKH